MANEIEKPKKEKKDRKTYIKDYNTKYYEEHKQEILVQKKQSRQETQDEILKLELIKWKEDKLNDPHGFEPFYYDIRPNEKNLKK
jgi:hypothetical protein